jgi:hypothetical protein
VIGGQLDETIEHVWRCRRAFAAGPSRGLDDGVVIVEQSTGQRGSHQRRQGVIGAAVPSGGLLAGAAPNRRVGILEAGEQLRFLQRSEAIEGAKGGGSDFAVRVPEKFAG